jgi:hypothetical protein
MLSSIVLKNDQKQERLVQLSRGYDTKVMEIALEYSGLLFYELEMSRVNVRAENALVESLQRQATAAFQMKLFSEYLSLETKGLVTLVTLSKESEQYKRCKKAIKDNITASFLRKGSYQGVRVLNVYHLSNQWLSRQLQVGLPTPRSDAPLLLFLPSECCPELTEGKSERDVLRHSQS